jgi:hypothetical protein
MSQSTEKIPLNAAFGGTLDSIFGSSVEVRFNGELILQVSLDSTVKRPKNSEELHKLLRKILAISEDTDVPDKEVLGKFSPDDIL